jgi:8-oxo-dGTP diphosphatase
MVVRDGRVLLGKRAAGRALYPGVWDVFGGHQEAGESIAETLVRELEEEIDLTPLDFVELGVLDEPKPETNGARAYHIFAVTDWRGPGPTMLGDEHSEIAWFTIEAALALDLALAGYKPFLAGLQK